MSIPVSDIHAAGGLDKWIRKQSQNTENCAQIVSGLRKSANAAHCMGADIFEQQKQKAEVPTEHEEQVAFVEWARQWLPENLCGLLFAIPNGGMRHKKTAADLKKEGVVKGTPDLFFAWPRLGKHGLFIEMKRVKGGTVSPEQKEMIERLAQAGYATVVCRGCEEAKDAMKRYILGKEW